MADLVQFDATTPIVIPAVQEVVYDKYWMTMMRVEARNPEEPVRVVVVFAPARDVQKTVPVLDADGKPVLDGDGNPTTAVVTVKELYEKGGEKRMVVEDIFALAATNPQVGGVIGPLLEVFKALATEKGIL